MLPSYYDQIEKIELISSEIATKERSMKLCFSCMPVFDHVFPTKASSKKEDDEVSSKPKLKEEHKKKKKKKKEEEANKKHQSGKQKKSNLDMAASMTPSFPFHSRPGLR